MHSPHSAKVLAGLGALSALSSFSFSRAVEAQPGQADKAAHSTAATPVDKETLPKALTDLPPYVQKRYAFSVVLNTTVTATDRQDKQPFAEGDVVMMQACPPGYSGASNPSIHDYPMQRVTSMTFGIIGTGSPAKALPFVKNPAPGQTDFWTLGTGAGGERANGWDTIILKFHVPAGADVKVRSQYDGENGSSVYSLVTGNVGQALTPQEKAKFLSLSEAGVTTSKEAMDSALAQVGLLRKADEGEAQYTARVAAWTNDEHNIPHLLNSMNSDIPFSIINHVAGNCNHVSNIQAMTLRSQGIAAKMISGMISAGPGGIKAGHAIAEFYDSQKQCWFRLGQDSVHDTNPANVFDGKDIDFVPFQLDTTFKYPRTFSRSPTSTNGCGEWNVCQNGSFVANVMGVYDAQNSTSHPTQDSLKD